MQSVHIPRAASDLAPLLRDGALSDLSIRVGGQEIRAHRVLLASASDVLKAKFTAAFSDATEKCWHPEVGGVAAWTWTVRWIYGCGEALPWPLFVEVLLLADCYQVGSLLAALLDLDLAPAAEVLAPQILGAVACPRALEPAAQKVAAALCPGRLVELLRVRRWPGPEGGALLAKHLFLASQGGEEGAAEEQRLRFLGALRRGRAGFPEAFVEAVRWESFPAEALQRGLQGELAHFERAFGAPMRLSEGARIAMREALARRQGRLRDAGKGIFAWMLEQGGYDVRVGLSSRTQGSEEGHEVLSPERKTFMTGSERNACVELGCEDVEVKVRAVGLRHGRTDGLLRCRCFVVEGCSHGQWTRLLAFEDRPLGDEAEVFPVDQSMPGLYSRFRIRQTGANSSGTWSLCLSWFDVFGSMETKVLAGLREALAKGSPGLRRKRPRPA